ncbi:MAG: PKD domain-containing protein, partial [Thermoplasmata archaeon]|nr:PKD domain-containing protein [Thermoplasmata archaeon]
LTWTDDVTGFMSHEENFSMVLIPGDHHVILTFEDGNGPSTRANVSFSVRQNIPTTVRISVPADDARYFDYQTVVFNASASSDAEGHYLTYTWVSDKAGVLGYGDKISRKLGPGVHVITLWVDDSWANVTKNVTIRIMETFPPTVVMASPVHGQTYVTTTRVSFDANGTFDPDSDILEYFWKSNINGLLSERPQFLTKLSVGHHFITLSVDDGNYNVSTTIEIDVSDNRAPMAIISSPEHEASYYSLDLIELNASDSYDLEDPLTYFWVSSREGTLGNEPIITLNLARGEHTITLWVNDGHGHNISSSVEVTILNLGPTAGISSPEPGTLFNTAIPVQFMSATSFDPEGDKLTYKWYLRPSDGEWTQIGTTARLERTFKTPGHYDIKLVVSDNKETDEITSTFQVKMSDEVDGSEDDLLSNPVFLGAIGLGLIIAVVAIFFLLKARD